MYFSKNLIKINKFYLGQTENVYILECTEDWAVPRTQVVGRSGHRHRRRPQHRWTMDDSWRIHPNKYPIVFGQAQQRPTRERTSVTLSSSGLAKWPRAMQFPPLVCWPDVLMMIDPGKWKIHRFWRDKSEVTDHMQINARGVRFSRNRRNNIPTEIRGFRYSGTFYFQIN